jgi:MoCo/4Fe-4S cofactor protein with predicted Tat translocation signal
MPSNTRYWKDLGELAQHPEVVKAGGQEFPEPLSVDAFLSDKGVQQAGTGRRDFLKFLGFSLGAATLAACETPVIKSIPYLNKPGEITPGVANWYASTFYDGSDFASVLVKTREGRPIHIKGNPRFGLNRDPENKAGLSGSINARINSSVLSLYDSERLQGPVQNTGEGLRSTSWVDADKAITAGVQQALAQGKRAVVLTGTVISPSTRAAIAAFMAASPGVEHVMWDTVSYNGCTAANALSFGRRAMPSYDLSKAQVIVGVGADFLSTWGSTTEHSWQYTKRRKPADGMSRHFQFEARMSLTGANADVRMPVRVSDLPLVVLSLHDHVAKHFGLAAAGGSNAEMDALTAKAAEELIAAAGKSVVLSGSNDVHVQVVVNAINGMLGNYGSTIDMAQPTNFLQGDDAAMAQLVKDMNAGGVQALFIQGVNPAYSLPNAAEFKEGLRKVALSVSFSSHADETASRCTFICPDHHWLESWNDQLPKPGHYAVTQPTIRNLFNTRQWQESLLRWSGRDITYHAFMQEAWASAGLGAAWQQAVHDGVYITGVTTTSVPAFAADVRAAAGMAAKSVAGASNWQLELYEKESIGNGNGANNPWLQEMPDPVSKVTWDNYVCMAPLDLMELLGTTDMKDLYIGQDSQAHVVKVTVNGVEIKLPALPSPGQKRGTMAIALGYGRGADGERVGKACFQDNGNGLQSVGSNAYPLASWQNGAINYSANNAQVELTGERYALALTQTHMTLMDRSSVLKETSLAVYKTGNKHHFNHGHELAVHEDVDHNGVVDARDKEPVAAFDLWDKHPVEQVGHRWGMSIDLNSCIGCGACVTACTSENNVPVVGKDEVRRSREMHWLRIDRYYSSDMTHDSGKEEGLDKIERYLRMEDPSESPRVVFQPVMCQHCNHAPCETVCPVAATTHSNEGLNMMAYNRCIGTRYCANNCPYKVRRFNWFNYVSNKFEQVNPAFSELGRMVLNPDVTVRSRGVIEKCSLCVQQIQAGKLAAKKAGKPVADGSVQTACMAACGTGAIVFGDLNDGTSKVASLAAGDRAYSMLEEVGTKPNIYYLLKVRNSEEEKQHAEAHHA